MDFIHWAWLFPVAITLHNLEEAIWLPYWSKNAGKFHRNVNPCAFRFAVAVLTLTGFVVAFWATQKGPQSIGSYLLTGYALGMLINVLVPHLFVSLSLRQYMPGLATALLLNFPVSIKLIRSAFAEGYVQFSTFIYFGIAVCVFLIGSIPLLLKVGEKLVCK